jgi:hypothetical protein
VRVVIRIHAGESMFDLLQDWSRIYATACIWALRPPSVVWIGHIARIVEIISYAEETGVTTPLYAVVIKITIERVHTIAPLLHTHPSPS